MKIEASTLIMRLIEPGLYGTLLGSYYEELFEEYEEEFKKFLCETAKETINEIFDENVDDLRGHCFVDDMKFQSPRFYNYGNDWVEFDLFVPDSTIDFIMYDYYSNNKDLFLKYAKEKFGSYDGFISFAPYRKDDFEDAINNRIDKNKFERAITMYIMFVIESNGSNLTGFQRDFEDKVIEHGSSNGWYESDWDDYDEEGE